MPRGRIRRSERAARPVSPMIQGRKASPSPLKQLSHASLYASPIFNPLPSAGVECSPPLSGSKTDTVIQFLAE